jgi:hypothetical protein
MSVDMPEKMATFVDEIIDSFVIWDLLIAFSRRPEAVGSAETFSALLGRSADDVSVGLKRLGEKGFLKVSWSETEEQLFALDPHSELKEALQEFAAFNDIQENRLKILSRLLHRGVSR